MFPPFFLPLLCSRVSYSMPLNPLHPVEAHVNTTNIFRCQDPSTGWRWSRWGRECWSSQQFYCIRAVVRWYIGILFGKEKKSPKHRVNKQNSIINPRSSRCIWQIERQICGVRKILTESSFSRMSLPATASRARRMAVAVPVCRLATRCTGVCWRD